MKLNFLKRGPLVLFLVLIIVLGLIFLYKITQESNLKGGKKISWEEAKKLVRDCQIEFGFQAHSQYVTLNLKNGTEVYTYEPEIDLILKEAERVKDKCGEVQFAIE